MLPLFGIYGKNVLSGQQETSWSNPAGDISFYTSNVGKAPAMLGGDYLYPSGTSSRALAYWNAGGLTMIRYHMGAPPNADTYQNSMLGFSTTQCDNVIKSGTAENTSLLSKLNYVATEVGTLQNGACRADPGAVPRNPAKRLVLVEQVLGQPVHRALQVQLQLPGEHEGESTTSCA